MSPPGMVLVERSVSLADLRRLAQERFGDMVKAVVDVDRRVMVVGGDLHSDQEALLLQYGSRQVHLWGINIYPAEPRSAWIEYDSMINLRPAQGNRSRGVEDEVMRERIRVIVDDLVEG